MQCHILTLFPEAIEHYLAASILGRAQEQGLLTIQTHNVRDFATDRHRTVDDTPYGGGPGMVLKVEPIERALAQIGCTPGTAQQRIVVLSARGHQFSQDTAARFAQLDQLVLLCGRYEGIDQRVTDFLADEEVSIGPYVLAGGELAALVALEATARLLPGVLGNPASLAEESHAIGEARQEAEPYVEYPQYTKPAEYKGWHVPEVLLSGNHEEIRRWREAQSKRLTPGAKADRGVL